MRHLLTIIIIFCLLPGCKIPTVNFPKEGETKLVGLDSLVQTLKLPQGFKIEVYARDIENARSMAIGEKGTLFVGNRGKDKVYGLVDLDGDNKVDKVHIIAENLNMPNGVAFKNGDLYVAEVNRILKFADIENKLENPPAYEVVYDKFPSEKHHGWKFIAFGPDEKLYVPVGAPCNVCEEENEIYATITRMSLDGSDPEIVAKGVRNSVGFAWHPTTEELWFTENGRDMMGDDTPPCELNHAPNPGMHFGFPYCHAGDTLDPKFGDNKNCDDFTDPAQKLGAHVAPLGMRFYTGDMFPTTYKNQIFFAEHGSWNRSKKSGYVISLCKLEDNKIVSYETFVEGWLDEDSQDVWGRPVDVLQLEDGSMLVSDDFADAIYRISYK